MAFFCGCCAWDLCRRVGYHRLLLMRCIVILAGCLLGGSSLVLFSKYAKSLYSPVAISQSFPHC